MPSKRSPLLPSVKKEVKEEVKEEEVDEPQEVISNPYLGQYDEEVAGAASTPPQEEVQEVRQVLDSLAELLSDDDDDNALQVQIFINDNAVTIKPKTERKMKEEKVKEKKVKKEEEVKGDEEKEEEEETEEPQTYGEWEAEEEEPSSTAAGSSDPNPQL